MAPPGWGRPSRAAPLPGGAPRGRRGGARPSGAAPPHPLRPPQRGLGRRIPAANSLPPAALRGGLPPRGRVGHQRAQANTSGPSPPSRPSHQLSPKPPFTPRSPIPRATQQAGSYCYYLPADAGVSPVHRAGPRRSPQYPHCSPSAAGGGADQMDRGVAAQKEADSSRDGTPPPQRGGHSVNHCHSRGAPLRGPAAEAAQVWSASTLGSRPPH